MANTIMTAKNTFAEGLIMDFAPDNTQATCLTSALNATLLTFNGNEMSLQNDMGNGRVETAFLPEGYVPVGTCEFGDIIYIVSYNPLTNKSLIGCFPSPERNISSEELYDNGQTGYLSLSYVDFLGKTLTGKLNSVSVKKVLIDNKKLNPGDKYIIYTNSDSITLNLGYLSDYGKLNGKVNETHNTLPKYVKLHVVSIEDSGKITYLDTTTKWYDINDLKYYISSQKIGPTETDLDSYRNLVLSNWSIFSSKVSGKLAILAELEMIDTFSCSYDLEHIENTERDTELIKYKTYELYLCPDAYSKKNIELPYICLTKASFNNSLEELKSKDGQSYSNLDPNWVYYYGANRELGIEKRKTFKATDISANDLSGWEYSDMDEKKRILIGTVTIPDKHRESADKDWVKILSNSFIYTMEVTPTMVYGRLEHLAVQIVIDFNKIGTGEVSLNTWKYHNAGTTSILTYGIEAYPKPNWEVTDVIILFYDNLGLVGEYLLNDKKYYSGVFTEYFGLDGESTNSRFNRHDSIKDKAILHQGEEVPNPNKDEGDNNYIVKDGKTYINDAATLYSGFLYAAKIIVKQRHKDNKELTMTSDPLFRWFWTNAMFNEYYYSVKDFKELKFELILNGEAIFETTPYYQWKQKELNNLSAEYTNDEVWKTYSANALYIGYGKENNINMYVYAGLLNDYGCFNLHGFDEKGNVGDIQNIGVDIYLSKSEIKYTLPENQYEYSNKEGHVSEALYLLLVNQTNTEGCTEVADNFSYYLENASNLVPENRITSWENNIKDSFNIYFSNSYNECLSIDQEDESIINTPVLRTTLNKCYYMNGGLNSPIPLSMLALLFNKAYVQGEQGGTIQVPVYTPIIDTSDDLEPLGIKLLYNIATGIKLAFESAVALCHRQNDFSAARLLPDGDLNFYAAVVDDSDVKVNGDGRLIDITGNADFLNTIWGNIGPEMKTFFPVYLGGHGGDKGSKFYNAIGGTINNYITTREWKYKYLIPDTSERNSSKLTEGTFDITRDANLDDMKTSNSISFLGVKYKDGLTVLNIAFMDTVSGNMFTLKDYQSTASGYDNFAYLLYLLLSNAYHKNKRILDHQIKVKNYVRNGDYDVELIKHIFVHLKVDEEKKEEPRNIIMRGFDFKNYVTDVTNKAELGCPEGFESESNVSLHFLDYAKDHELKVIVNSLPMQFFDVEVEAYIRRNGLLLPVSDLAPATWYVYLNGKLEQYANSTLVFHNTDITANLKYVFADYIEGNENPKLLGVHFKESTIFSDEDTAYNTYLRYLKEYIMSETQYARYYSTYEEAMWAREQYINNMFDSFPDSVSGYSKLLIREIFTLEGIFNLGDGNLFDIHTTSNAYGQLYVFVIQQPLVIDDTLLLERPGTEITASYCELPTHKFLNIFDYLDLFMTSSTKQLGQTFGVKGKDLNSAYTGFAKEIMLNTYHKVV